MRPILQPRPEDQPYLRKLGWTVAIAAALLMVWRASNLLLLAFGAVIGAIVFLSAGRLFMRLGVRHAKLALILGMALVLAIFGGMGWLATVQFGGQFSAMLADLPATLARIERALSTTVVGHTIVEATHATMGGGTIANRVGSFALTGGKFVVNFMIVLIGAMFIAAKPAPYLRGIVLLTPPAGRPAMERALGEVSTALRLWLKQKLLAMSAMLVLISGGLWLAGLKSWAALGLLGGLSEFVPYVGPTVAMVPAIGLAALAGGHVLWRTLIAFVVIRLIEAYLLTPALNDRVLAIPPALTLFTILGVGAVFGVYGVFFAGALLVVAFVLVRELYLHDTLGEDIEGVPEEVRE